MPSSPLATETLPTPLFVSTSGIKKDRLWIEGKPSQETKTIHFLRLSRRKRRRGRRRERRGKRRRGRNQRFLRFQTSRRRFLKHLVNEAPIREEEEDEKEEVEEGNLSSSALPHFLIFLSAHDTGETLTQRQRGADSLTKRPNG